MFEDVIKQIFDAYGRVFLPAKKKDFNRKNELQFHLLSGFENPFPILFERKGLIPSNAQRIHWK